MWANADGQPLGQVIQRFLPPWQEAAQGGASGRPGTYQQLAAVRKLGSSRSSGSGTSPVVPSSTPWVSPGVPTTAPSLKGAGSAAASMSALSLEPPRLRNGGSVAAAAAAAVAAASANSVGASSRRPVIVWLRRDLRLADNPALHAAAASGRPVLPVFIWAVSLLWSAASCSAALCLECWLRCQVYRQEGADAGCKSSCVPAVSPRALLQPEEWGHWPPGGAAMHWLHNSLACLDADLQRRYGTRVHFYNASSPGSSSAQVGGLLGRGRAAQEALSGRHCCPLWCGATTEGLVAPD
jgi:hypothetical protein